MVFFMNKNVINDKKQSSIFNRWKAIQKEIQKSRFESLKDKKKFLPMFKDEYESLLSMIKKNDDGSFEFNFSFLIRSIKYINDTNDFFNRRFKIGDIDEILLLIYIFEWVCLNKEKDPTLLGTKDQVINKFKAKVRESGSNYKEIFEDLVLSNQSDFEEFKKRISFFVKKTHDKLIEFISKDLAIYTSIEQTKNALVDFDDYEVCNKVWKDTFCIFDDKVDYIYNLENSDDSIIYVSIEADKKQVAFIKFRMFQTFVSKNSKVVPNGFSKEILRIDFVDKRYEHMIGMFLSNSLKIANRVIKNIFLPELQLEIFNSEKPVENNVAKSIEYNDKNNKVVRIISKKKIQ